MVAEDDTIGHVPARLELPLGMVERKGAEIMRHIGGNGNLNILCRPAVVDPDAKGIVEIRGRIDGRVGGERLLEQLEGEHAVEGKGLSGDVALVVLLVSQDVPASQIGLHAVGPEDGLVGV